MEWLNYHHLFYFWTVAREGSVTRAAAALHLAQPTLTAQIRTLEGSLGGPLFTRVGRGLAMTDLGRVAYGYAEQIFGLGRELLDASRGRTGAGPIRFAVGISDALSKLTVFRLLRPALELEQPVRLSCIEEGNEVHFAMLLRHELDLVLSDVPFTPRSGPRAYNHLLGEAPVKLYGTKALLRRHPGSFPGRLRGAPFLLPPRDTALRRALDHWLDRERLEPAIVAEISDGALLKTFGGEGRGFLPAPAVLEEAMARQHGLHPAGEVPGIRERIYAVSAERRLQHPAVLAIREAAVREVFV
ncbi:transcriptional activator NhaR [Mesoterricola sediminis]|uniref:LysR family transcriptional regulator n=1 Tax=Mesoterricola sediminis TaxID=2927980 RepID=A0AA48KDN0_9BACT|nr:transcriptional activator NhaR [Mesoterricola sediminis]BDU78381.1 LysR family transcriptional regulator [Mesoterricola sediminis]